jgi:sugar O-acyltransferase (sialic acid O-acetyltransferase NeuD family)
VEEIVQDLVIIGAGGFAREVAFLVRDINRRGVMFKFLGYIDSDPAHVGTRVGDDAVIGTDDWLAKRSEPIAAVIGIGTPAVIAKVVENLRKRAVVSFPNLIHPSVIGDFSRIQFGQGNIVCAGNIFTTDIRVGSFNIINLTNTIGHDAVIGDCCVINPGCNISGSVEIGNRVLFGTGAKALQGKKIGDDAQVGAGAVVVKDVPPGVTVVGVPAKPLQAAPQVAGK